MNQLELLRHRSAAAIVADRRARNATQIAQAGLVDKLRDRCAWKGLRVTSAGSLPHYCIHLHDGRELVEVPVSWDDTRQLRRLVHAVSSELSWLGQYAAFVELTPGRIEAGIKAVCPQDSFLPRWVADYSYRVNTKIFPDRRAAHTEDGSPDDYPRCVEGVINACSDDRGIVVEISRPSTLASVMAARLLPPSLRMSSWDDPERQCTIKIEKVGGFQDTDEALDLLERVARSLSYELDRLTPDSSQGFELCARAPWPPDRHWHPDRPRVRLQHVATPLLVTLNTYCEDSLGFYWRGRRSRSDAVNEYKEYYLVLERNFARYMDTETIEFARQQILDAHLNSNDAIAVLLATLSDRWRSGKSQLARLRATLEHCLSPQALIAFIEGDEELKRHVSRVKTIPGIQRLAVRRHDLVEQLANRIHQIRNQTLHADESNKAGGRVLRPNAKELVYLPLEVKLIRFAAQAVLTASATPTSTR
ncbi:hypothetical protein BC739_004053 [Kutzneria viridogrisea]|uniref:ApeA N-terminal domain-containing protein n=1 Tax=Kutzneria viridogrisea TaxID=47990 RepID=A0ABR6BIX6_9PSEU|nr:hypothetical protein [Kutzneria viridogrisea]